MSGFLLGSAFTFYFRPGGCRHGVGLWPADSCALRKNPGVARRAFAKAQENSRACGRTRLRAGGSRDSRFDQPNANTSIATCGLSIFGAVYAAAPDVGGADVRLVLWQAAAR